MSTQQTTSSFDFSTDLSIQACIEKAEYPHRDPEILEELYVERELTTWECAERLGCSQQTVRRWLDKHDIETRRSGSERVERAAYNHDSGGHPKWDVRSEGETKTVYVHQLTAIMDGADPAEVFDNGTHTHHKNEHPFDNRSENIEVVSQSDHRSAHNSADTERQYDDELGCFVINIARDE
ncbi:helix-turn-helix domain-containing protein [Haloarcula japonica]|uniref:helix-turn-helix domain-containing protein n=1 Tax=Haloarcula japonica TaxID=29282 RepID=UPI0039F69AAB